MPSRLPTSVATGSLSGGLLRYAASHARRRAELYHGVRPLASTARQTRQAEARGLTPSHCRRGAHGVLYERSDLAAADLAGSRVCPAGAWDGPGAGRLRGGDGLPQGACPRRAARHHGACRPAIGGRRARRLARRVPLSAEDAGLRGGGYSRRSPHRGAAAGQAGAGQQAGPGRQSRARPAGRACASECRARAFGPGVRRRQDAPAGPARISPEASWRAPWTCASSTPARSRSRPWWWRRPHAASAASARPSAATSTSRRAPRRSSSRTPSTSMCPSASSSPTRVAIGCTSSRAATACSRSPPAPSSSTAQATAPISRPRRASWWPTSATRTGASWR